MIDIAKRVAQMGYRVQDTGHEGMDPSITILFYILLQFRFSGPGNGSVYILMV